MRFSLPNLPEAHILSDILAAYKRAKEFGNKTGYFYPTDDDLRAFFQSFAERHVADIVAKAKPSAALVLKDPNFIQVAGRGRGTRFPRSVRIVCMRDPRDIAASFVQIGQRQTAATKPGKYERRDINFISKKILASYQPLLHGGQAECRHGPLRGRSPATPKGALRLLLATRDLTLVTRSHRRPVWLDAEARHEASWISELEGAEAFACEHRVLQAGADRRRESRWFSRSASRS